MRKTLWLRFPTKQAYETAEDGLLQLLSSSDGNDQVVIYVENPKAKKTLPPNRNVKADKALLERLSAL